MIDNTCVHFHWMIVPPPEIAAFRRETLAACNLGPEVCDKGAWYCYYRAGATEQRVRHDKDNLD